LLNDQYKKSSIFPLPWVYKKGLFSSSVRLNILGKKNNAYANFFRTKMFIPDNNMFVTSFVLYSLLEAEKYGQIKIDESSFNEALQSLLTFQDKNYPKGIFKNPI
jgi:hypothetical protein